MKPKQLCSQMKSRKVARFRWVLLFFLVLASLLVLYVNSPILTSAQAQQIDASGTSFVYLPNIRSDRTGINVDVNSRQDVLDFYREFYLVTENVAADWTGDHNSCNAGTTSKEFRNATLYRINYFRAMAGVPGDITFSEEWNHKAQEAALMMSVNRQLSHGPDPGWTCYTEAGYEGASRSNLSLGNYGGYAVRSQMRDAGDNNARVGHRWWILHPATQVMGTGDVPPASGYPASNALWVVDVDHLGDPLPPMRQEFVAWPPPGFVPYQVVYHRWSFFQYKAGVDFTSASVEMLVDGDYVPVIIEYSQDRLVWRPEYLDDRYPWPKPENDTLYHITISDIVVGGESKDVAYDVIVFDPDS